MPFATAADYSDPRCWSAAGWQWRAVNAVAGPRYLRQAGGQWQQRRFGGGQALPLAAPAVHLSWFGADAWCRWAGRRLPSKAEWEHAAHAALCHLRGEVPTDDAGFHWGEVWEGTASRFLPYPGFRAHPYR
ncbi:SUMF1/EgtB/PvdO family nonheme iron enzyme, partial [Accumulibacter sp.]